MGGITFILGGARSGKSGFAQELAARLSATSAGSEVTYLATAAAGDEEMRLRITRHRQSRESITTKKLYPVGEGAGYAGGIISAAIDGLKTAERIISHYAPAR